MRTIFFLTSNLSRQRLALARAVYSKKDVYIFDEPLSAVDAHVAKWLFDRIIGPNGALSDRTRIVVTHRIQFAPEADFIVVMKNGSIHSTGTYEGTTIVFKFVNYICRITK